MATGKFCDENLTALATVSGGVWSTADDTKLENLKDDSRYVGAPARCEDCRDLAKSWFEILLPEPRLISTFAFLFHTMTLDALYRITATDTDDPTYAAPTLATGWEFVFPSVYDPLDLEWGVENWWTGTLAESERELYPPHRYAVYGEFLAQRIKVEIDDHTNPAGFIDIGGFLTASGWSPAVNYERGRQLQVIARDLLDETPSGRIIGEERTARRQLSFSYANLSDTEAQRWIDASVRSRTTRTVHFLPDADDPVAMLREGFPGTFEHPPGAQFTRQFLNATAIVHKEVLA